MEVLPGKDRLVHTSEFAEGRVEMSRRAWLRDQKAAEAEAQQPVAAE